MDATAPNTASLKWGMGEMKTAELLTLIREKPAGVVGIVVARQRHGEVVRDDLIRGAGSLENVVRRANSLEINGTRILFITRAEHLRGMQFDLLLVYTEPDGRYIQDSELRARLKPEGAWDRNIHALERTREFEVGDG
jgi:hypothetical protein